MRTLDIEVPTRQRFKCTRMPDCWGELETMESTKDVDIFRAFFSAMGVDHEVRDAEHWPGVERRTWMALSVAQAHFIFDASGKFVEVRDDEMGGVYPRIGG